MVSFAGLLAVSSLNCQTDPLSQEETEQMAYGHDLRHFSRLQHAGGQEGRPSRHSKGSQGLLVAVPELTLGTAKTYRRLAS